MGWRREPKAKDLLRETEEATERMKNKEDRKIREK